MFVPLLALGLPVTATASILLAAMHDVRHRRPGPTLMTDQPDLIWTLLASLLIGNTLLLVINLPLAPLWAKLLRIPRPQLYAGILFFASLGAYSVNQDPFDLALLLVFGGLGFAIRRFGIPVLPLILGVILGPLMEVKLREALDLSGGEVSGLFNEGAGDLRLRRSSSSPSSLPIVLGRLRGRQGRCPRRTEGGGRPMTVVVGYIPDQYGEAALAAGIEEAERRQTGLVVVNATKGDALVDQRYVGDAGLADARGAAGRASTCRTEVRQTMGRDVADEIVRVAAETDADAIVIGLRHRTPVGKMIMGSVAQQVLLDAPCWVIAVKPAVSSRPTGAEPGSPSAG